MIHPAPPTSGAFPIEHRQMPKQKQKRQVDLLLVGHVTRDLIGETPRSGWRLGGTVSFAAITALRLGRKPTIITRAAQASDLGELPNEVERIVLPAANTTTFANIYTPEGRVQYCYTPAPPIRAADIPAEYRHPNVVLLGPLVNEIGPDLPSLFDDDTLVVAVPQGWMRIWDETGRVSAKPWTTAEDILPHLDVLVLSLEDIAYDLSRLEQFFKYVPTVVVTEYRDGSTLYQRNAEGVTVETKIPPRKANEVDPTGAGDIFATAFLLRLQETGDPVQSARFANITASFGVEHLGVAGIPSREKVLEYMAQHPFDPKQS